MDATNKRGGRPEGAMPEEGLGVLGLMLNPGIAPLTWTPQRLGQSSAWWEHVPFAHWLTAHLQPRVLVELGTYTGVSYSAFCEAVLRTGSDTQCYAIDTWLGDQHSGKLAAEVFEEFKKDNSSRYGQFSQLLRMTFQEAAPSFGDGSVDLLHIDGYHTYEAVLADFEQWLPKVSDRGVVMFHDIVVRERNFGVWRLWAEVQERYPTFEFLHGHGLGVAAVGSNAPSEIKALFRLDSASTSALRNRFAELGRQSLRQSSVSRLEDREKQLASLREKTAALESQFAAKDGQLAAIEGQLAVTEAQLSEARAAVNEFRTEAGFRSKQEGEMRSRLALRLRKTREHAEAQRTRLDALNTQASTLANQLKQALDRNAQLRRAAAIPEGERRSVKAAETAPARNEKRWVFVSGEPTTPGHVYRVRRIAAAAKMLGVRTSIFGAHEFEPVVDALRAASVLFIWRAPLTVQLSEAIAVAREEGCAVVFDVDDLMIIPELVDSGLMDSVHFQASNAETTRKHYGYLRKTMEMADFCTATTAELAYAMRNECGLPTEVIPNGFDDASFVASRLAARRASKWKPGERKIRIGYAGGTLTHQRDFSVCAAAVASVLRARPQAVLVLFRAPGSQTGLLDICEFPEFDGLESQIEWRNYVPLPRLCEEIARFDINIVPLDAGNSFCEAKSELKFFEAALVDVPTLASPTGPFARVIGHGISGYLARSEEDWSNCLMALVDDPQLRSELAKRALLTALQGFGEQARAEALRFVLSQLEGGDAASQSMRLRMLAQRTKQAPVELPHFEVTFESDRLTVADVTVVVLASGTFEMIEDTLESIRTQSLECLDLVIVNDGSRPDLLDWLRQWFATHGDRFGRFVILRGKAGQGSADIWNIGTHAADTLHAFLVEAGTSLLADCCAKCLEAVAGVAFSYPVTTLRDGSVLSGAADYLPARLDNGNFIGKTALIAKSSWAFVGGFPSDAQESSDFGFWRRLAECGLSGRRASEAPLAEYRSGAASSIG